MRTAQDNIVMHPEEIYSHNGCNVRTHMLVVGKKHQCNELGPTHTSRQYPQLHEYCLIQWTEP